MAAAEYTRWRKRDDHCESKTAAVLSPLTSPNAKRFSQFFHTRLIDNLVIKVLLRIPSCLKHVATLYLWNIWHFVSTQRGQWFDFSATFYGSLPTSYCLSVTFPRAQIVTLIPTVSAIPVASVDLVLIENGGRRGQAVTVKGHGCH